ncbi:MAG: hypothetical protein KJ749_08980 [Planctomycetes bacterium]|nr:hypothetical protein [Planctomycetota bacterium]
MRKYTVLSALLTVLLIVGLGCGPKSKTRQIEYTAENNPTAKAGRGDPTLDKITQPAAWILIDGYEGRYTEVNGNPQVQWIIDEPVSATPTFRVEGFEPLLGKPTDFSCLLKTIEPPDGVPGIQFGIAANEGTFEAGRDYSLTAPGDDFVIRDPTGATLTDIGPLDPGRYLVAGGLKQTGTDTRVVAITYFTVGERR